MLERHLLGCHAGIPELVTDRAAADSFHARIGKALSPIRQIGYDHAEFGLKVLQYRPAEAMDGFCAHRRMRLHPRDDLVLRHIGVGHAGDLLTLAHKLIAAKLYEPPQCLLERVGFTRARSRLQTKAPAFV